MLADSKLEGAIIKFELVDVAVMVDRFFLDYNCGCLDGLRGQSDEISAQSLLDVF